MSLSLGKICQLMENSALIGDKDDNLAIEAIKKGLDLRSNTKEGQTFWDDFMRVTGNAKALGHLLGVDPVHVMKWRERIHKYYKQVMADRRNEELNKNKRNRMINTGDGAQGDNSQGKMATGQQVQQGNIGNPGLPGI
jgi:cytochrome P450